MSTQHPSLRSVDERLRHRLRTAYGVISRDQAHLDGATDVQIRHWVKTGEWQSLFRHVFRHGAAAQCPEQTILAACLAVSPHAVASHQAAAWLWQLLDHAPATPMVTVPKWLHRSVPGIWIHRSGDLDLLRVLERKGIPCTDPLRTLVDLAGATERTTLDDAIDRAVGRRLVTVDGLMAEVQRLARRGRRGVPQMRAALRRRGFVGIPNPSVLESRTARAFQTYGVILPKAEVTVGPHGEYRLDYARPEVMVALEVDGYVWHFSPEHKSRDDARRRRLMLEGWQVLVYSCVDVTRYPAKLVREYLTAVSGRQAVRP